MRFAGLSQAWLYIRPDGRLSYDPADAAWFDTVGDAYGHCLANGWEPHAKDDITESHHEPDHEQFEKMEEFLNETRSLDGTI